MNLHPNADPLNRRPTNYNQNNGGQNLASNRVQGNAPRTQSLSLPSKSKKPGNGALRMYRFEKYPYTGRKPGWEIAERTFLGQRSQSSLKDHIKNPSKDKKTGRSNARDIDSDDVVGNRGHKRNQILQLIADLNCEDESSEWHHELIELLELVHDAETGNLNCDKMLVTVKRGPRRSHFMRPPRVFDLNKDVVDVGFFQSRQDPRADQHQNGFQQRPQAHMNMQAARQPQHAGPSRTAGLARPAGPSQRDGPSYQSQSQHGHDARADLVHNVHEVFYDDEEDYGGDDHYSDRDEGGKIHVVEKKGKKDKKYKMDSYGKTDKDEKKEKKKQKSKPVIPIKHSKADLSDSDSSIDSYKDSDAGTYRTADTEPSIGSAPDSPLFAKFFGDKGKKVEQKHAADASREHHRKNPIDYHPESRGRSAKDDNILLTPGSPASRSSRRHSSSYPTSYPRQPSFHRDRPSRPPSEDFDEQFRRKYDAEPDGRRLAVFERPRITQPLAVRDDLDVVKEVLLENLMLRRDIEARARPMPPYDDRRSRYDDRMRFDDRRYEDDRRSFRH